jgi:hypothetical protein
MFSALAMALSALKLFKEIDMAQRPTSDFDIDPNITSGTDLANILNRFQDAMDSGNSGASRPAYLAAGGMWVKEGDPMRLYLYDGSKDIELYNTTDGIVGAIEDGTVDGQVTTWSASAGEWMPNNAVIVKDGNVGIGVDNPSGINLYVKRESSGWAGSVARTNMVLENSTSTALQFLSENTGSNIIRFGDSDATGSGYIQYRHSTDAMEFATQGTERTRIDADGRFGIGGEPGTRTIDEAKALAKTKLTAWKAEVKKRTAEQPEASTQEITLEVTDGDFGVMPTEQALAEFLQERAIGGGDAKLQVAGGGYFSGQVQSGNGQIVRPSTNTGLFFNDQRFTPCTAATGSYLDATLDLGKTDARWKDGHFSGSVTSGDLRLRGDSLQHQTTNTGIVFGSGVEVLPADGAGNVNDGAVNLGRDIYQFKNAFFSGTVYANGSPLTRATDLIETLSTLREATRAETTLEGLRDALSDAIGGLIQKFEAQVSTTES